jgi:hypothetical protein
MKLESLLGISAKDLGLRFNLVGLMPMVLLVLFWMSLAWSGAPAQAPQLGQIFQQAEGLSAAQWILLGLGVLALAAVLQPLQTGYLRLLEGYWGSSRVGTWLSRLGVERQRKARQALLAATRTDKSDPNDISPDELERMNAAAYALQHNYPKDEGRLLPTALGNQLRAAEARPYENYGLDALVTWPSLAPLLSPDLKATLADQRNQLDLAARLQLTFILCAVLGGIYLYRWGWWLLVPLGALGLAWLAYRAAVSAALAYGESIQAAYHLHRFDLLEALHLPLPPSREEEMCANQQLSNFLKDGSENLRYEHGSK